MNCYATIEKPFTVQVLVINTNHPFSYVKYNKTFHVHPTTEQ